MYSFRELKPKINITSRSVECPVIGCGTKVERQRRSFRCEKRFYCPGHKIFISPSTFEYEYKTENLLWKSEADIELLEAVLKVKRECRIARDNSEDAVSWNIFRYLETTTQLGKLLSMLTQTEQHQVELIYWSYSQKNHGSWPELNHARKEFGENLQRSSEPDLIVISDNGLFFIEAKLTATNNTTPSNRNSYKKYLVGGERWFQRIFTCDYETIAIKARKYEMLRFWLLGSWLASQTGRDFFLINLVLSGREMDIQQRFLPYIRMEPNRQFIKATWEDIYGIIESTAPESNEKRVLQEYFRNKTIGYRLGVVQKAFSIA